MDHRLCAAKWGAIFLIAAGWAVPLTAQQAHYDERWTEINQYSPVETFQSRGSLGWHLGAGVIQRARSDADQKSTVDSQTSTVPQRIPRFYLSKGTPWPLDFGLSLAQVGEGDMAWQYGGHVQWTLFESFKLPTLALRASRIETAGLQSVTRLRTDSVQLGSSFAVLRYITLSAAYGLQWQSWESYNAQAGLALDDRPSEEVYEKAFFFSWGLKAQLFSPFVSIGYEQTQVSEKQRLDHLQLAILL